MAKSLQERTAELQNRKFSGAPAFNIEPVKVTGGFDSAVEEISGLSNVFKKIESKILEKEKVATIKDLSSAQLAKYGITTKYLTNRKDEMALSFQNQAMTDTYKEMLRQGVFPTRIANAVVEQRVMPKPILAPELPRNIAEIESTISAPAKPLNAAERSDLMMKESGARTRDNFREKLPLNLGKFIFGKSESDFTGQTESESENQGFFKGIATDFKQRGAVKFLFGNILKEPEAKEKDYMAELVSTGYTRDEASKKASSYIYENGKGLSDTEKRLLDKVEYERKAWAVLEVAELAPIFSKFVKASSKTA